LVITCYAEENDILSQAYTWGQDIDVFITGNMNSANIGCKVSNQAAEVVESGLLADKGITVKTTLLVDVSTSIPPNLRENIKSYINSLIENIGKNEQYKIVTFGKQLNTLQDFGADRYDLASAANKIEFNDEQSKIYDAIYNTIPIIQPIDDNPCYYRTIVITDGADSTPSGITKEELYLKLQKETYPIDVIAVNTASQPEQDKDLSALSRISGGRYFNLVPDTDIASLSSSTALSEIYWLRLKIPDSLLDGSTRQINIGDGNNSIQFDIKVPVSDLSSVETTLNETTPTVIATQSTLSVGNDNILIYIGIGIGIIILIAVVVSVIIIHRKRKRSNQKEYPVAPGKDTVILKDNDGKLCIIIRNVNSPDQVWDMSMVNEVLIGRDSNCQVCLADISVSHQQCKIYIDNGIMVENISTSNITQLNGEKLNSPAVLKAGDKLKCGIVTLSVDLAHISDDLKGATKILNI